MDDTWVCATCKSINRARADRCYSCHGPRDEAIGEGGAERRTIDAIANRTVRPYLPSWPLAALAGGLLVAVAVLGVVLLLKTADGFPAIRDAFTGALYSGVDPDLSALNGTVETAMLGLLRSGLVLLALLSFAGWLALATMNVPALGGGMPSRGPARVFIYTLIPIWNLFKVPGMVQDVLYRLDTQAGGAWMVMAATIGLLGSWFVNLVGGWIIVAAGAAKVFDATTREEAAAAFAGILDQSFYLSVLVEFMITVGTLLVVVLMVRVEARARARNKEINSAVTTLASGSPLDAPPAPRPPGPVATPAFASAPRPATPTAFSAVAPVEATPFAPIAERPPEGGADEPPLPPPPPA